MHSLPIAASITLDNMFKNVWLNQSKVDKIKILNIKAIITKKNNNSKGQIAIMLPSNEDKKNLI